jgi:hypothetical protein
MTDLRQCGCSAISIRTSRMHVPRTCSSAFSRGKHALADSHWPRYKALQKNLYKRRTEYSLSLPTVQVASNLNSLSSMVAWLTDHSLRRSLLSDLSAIGVWLNAAIFLITCTAKVDPNWPLRLDTLDQSTLVLYLIFLLANQMTWTIYAAISNELERHDFFLSDLRCFVGVEIAFDDL